MSSARTVMGRYKGTRNVLLVTDCYASVALYKNLLGSVSEVIKAKTVVEAFSKLEAGGVEMVFVTIGNTTVDSFHLFKALRENATTSEIPFVFLDKASNMPPKKQYLDQEMERINQFPNANGPVYVPANDLEASVRGMMGWP